jgi:hypothetical protein
MRKEVGMNKFLKRRAFGTPNPAGALIGGEGSDGNKSAGDGGGVYADYDGLTIDGSSIEGNTAAGAGGGIYLTEGGGATLKAGKLSGNAAGLGNGVFVSASGTLTLSPSGDDAISFDEDDAIFLPNSDGTADGQVSFNIGSALDPGVSGTVPLAFRMPIPDAVVAVATDEDVAAESYEKLESGDIVFYPDDIYIKIGVVL